MDSPTPSSRRSFLLGTATGVVAGIPLAWWASRHWRQIVAPYEGKPHEDSRPAYAMPGPFRGRVVEVRNAHAVSPDNVIDPVVVDGMVNRGMGALTGTSPDDVRGAWDRFFQKGDVVGIKVNPVGRKPKRGEPGRVPKAVGAISSPALLVKVVRCLEKVGIPRRDIVVFERYAEEFCDAGYADLVERELPGVRWMASAVRYTDTQVDISGFDQGRGSCSAEMGRHVVGYDPDVFTVMGFCGPQHENDERRHRSHLSAIVTRLVDKIITLPVLKDHRSAGVTLALKNMSHGMNNNVARSHLPGDAHGYAQGAAGFGPNQCNTFIPQAVAQHALRQKATLHILDGLIGVYEGGPGNWNKTWGTWRHKGLFFATDPVAMDHVGWDVLDAQRAAQGWPGVGQMGLVHQTPAVHASTGLTVLAGSGPLETAALATAAQNLHAGRASEVFNLRQPDHVVLAGKLGLGVFDADGIAHEIKVVRG